MPCFLFIFFFISQEASVLKDSFRHGILPQPVFCLVLEVLLGQIPKVKTLLPELQQRSLSSDPDIVSISPPHRFPCEES